jgi:branched-chain amino acid transport system permease protein
MIGAKGPRMRPAADPSGFRYLIGPLSRAIVAVPTERPVVALRGDCMIQSSDVANLLILGLLTYSMALSLRVGLFSIAPAAFAGLGAYTFGLLTVHRSWGITQALIAAVAISLIVGAILAWPLGRIRGVYTSIATLAVVVVLTGLESSLSITGGSLGLAGIPLGDVRVVGTIAVILVIAGFIYLDHSSLGRRLDVAGRDPVLARTLGIRVAMFKVSTLIISAGIAGFAGGLYAYEFNYIDPTLFTFAFAITIAANAVLGGHQHWAGPAIGTLILGLLGIYLNPIPGWSTIISGLTLTLIMIYYPSGIGGLLRRITRYRNAKLPASIGREAA